MARGATTESTGTSGFRTAWPSIGLPIAMDIGHMLRPGAGRGLKMSLGDLRHSIMGAGLSWGAEVGGGCPDRFRWQALSTSGPSMRRRWWRLSEEGQSRPRSNSAVRPELEWPGFLWVRATYGCPLTARAKCMCRE